MTTKRLRIVPVPGDSAHYLVVLDRMTMEGAAELEHLRDLGDTLTGCAGALVFADEVEVA